MPRDLQQVWAEATDEALDGMPTLSEQADTNHMLSEEERAAWTTYDAMNSAATRSARGADCERPALNADRSTVLFHLGHAQRAGNNDNND